MCLHLHPYNILQVGGLFRVHFVGTCWNGWNTSFHSRDSKLPQSYSIQVLYKLYFIVYQKLPHI